jgi:anti-sigma B factor antagonist
VDHYVTAGLGKPVARKKLPVSFFLSLANQVSRSWRKTARPCPPNISSHRSIYEWRLTEQNLVTHSVSLQCANSNHHRFHRSDFVAMTPRPPRPLTPGLLLSRNLIVASFNFCPRPGAILPSDLRGGHLAKLKTSTRQVDGVTIVNLSGRITLGEASVVVRDVINDLMGKGNKKILLNLVEVEYIDSSGIGVLVNGLSTVRSQGGELKLVNVSKRVRDLLQITKLYGLFDVKDDEPTAVASFR